MVHGVLVGGFAGCASRPGGVWHRARLYGVLVGILERRHRARLRGVLAGILEWRHRAASCMASWLGFSRSSSVWGCMGSWLGFSRRGTARRLPWCLEPGLLERRHRARLHGPGWGSRALGLRLGVTSWQGPAIEPRAVVSPTGRCVPASRLPGPGGGLGSEARARCARQAFWSWHFSRRLISVARLMPARQGASIARSCAERPRARPAARSVRGARAPGTGRLRLRPARSVCEALHGVLSLRCATGAGWGRGGGENSSGPCATLVLISDGRYAPTRTAATSVRVASFLW